MRQWTGQEDIRRHVMLAGSDNVGESGGLFYGAYCLQEPADEAAELLAWFRQHAVPHPSLLEIGTDAGGLTRLIDDVLECRSIHTIVEGFPASTHRRLILPHAVQCVGDLRSPECRHWLMGCGERFDLVLIGSERAPEWDASDGRTVLDVLAPGALVALRSCKSPGSRAAAERVAELRVGKVAGLKHEITIGQRSGQSVFRAPGEPVRRPYVPPVFDAVLLFHLYPSLARREQVEWHFRQLARYLPLFRRAYVNIATGEGLISPAEVRRRILAEAVSRGTEAGRIRFLETSNSQDGEVAPFFGGLLPLAMADGAEFAFYAHGKGTSHGDLTTRRAWVEIMYQHNLSNPRAIAALLRNHVAAGAFKAGGPGPDWYYPGTFFWFRPKEVSSVPGWRRHLPERWGVEHWLARFLPAEQGANLTPNVRWEIVLDPDFLDRYRRLPGS